MMNNIIVDSCFWFALLKNSDGYHKEATRICSNIFVPVNRIIIPFPSLYEVLNTTFIQEGRHSSFCEWMRNPSIILIPDDKYRTDALDQTLEQKKRELSLVDNVIRNMLDDRHLNIRAIVTFNVKDFYDVCLSHQIDIISSS